MIKSTQEEDILDKNLSNNNINEKIAESLDLYHSSDDENIKAKAKNNIVVEMIPVVKHIARTIARRATDPIEDLVQAGFIGLLKAIDNYSKSKNNNFKVYAGYLIIGEMKHYLRDKLNAIRVPRHIQELSIRINNFTRTLTAEQLQTLTNADVASALQVSPKSVDIVMQVERRGQTLSLEEIFKTDDDNLGYEEILADNGFKDFTDLTDAKIIINNIMPKLSDEAKMLIDMYYNKDMNQKEIAKALNTNQMNISRKMKRIFREIYTVFEEKAFVNKNSGENNE